MRAGETVPDVVLRDADDAPVRLSAVAAASEHLLVVFLRHLA